MANDETALRFAALSEAMCDALASVAADTAILRMILDSKKMVLDNEFDAALENFRLTDKWRRYRDQIAKDIHEKTKAKLDSMRGPVN